MYRANIETDIINYLHALGIQMKTDPLKKRDEFLKYKFYKIQSS